MRLTKYLAAAAAVVVAGVAAHSAGVFQTYPIIGGASYCASTIGAGPVQAGPTGFGAGAASPGATGLPLCGQTVPAGPPALTGTEVFPVDLYTPGTVQIAGGAATADLPVTAIGNGYGTSQVVTTNASVVVANGISTLISNQGAATIALINLPPNPFQNQRFCVVNAGSGLLTLTSIAVASGSGQSIVQGAQAATLAAQTNNAAAAAVSATCYQYNVANTTWYRIT